MTNAGATSRFLQWPKTVPALQRPFNFGRYRYPRRETVRRKLAKLVDLGWIEKTPDDMYVITDRIGTVFAAFDDSQTYDLMRTSEQIKNVLQS